MTSVKDYPHFLGQSDFMKDVDWKSIKIGNVLFQKDTDVEATLVIVGKVSRSKFGITGHCLLQVLFPYVTCRFFPRPPGRLLSCV